MKRFLIVAIWLCGSGICLAQDTKQEIQGLYQRIQGFTFNSGDPSIFDIEKANTNGGGYAIIYNITEKFGLFQQMGFFGGASQNGFNMRLITELQGFKVTKTKGPFDFYAKGGLGAVIWSFSGNFTGTQGGFAVNYGGGTEIKVKEGLYWVLEATRLTAHMPNLTGLPGRTGWNSSWLLGTGIAVHF
ncbi:MAG: hypothetical protein ABSH28_13150 [Acidobacteriota bacterium]|jgi:hypothetical protein